MPRLTCKTYANSKGIPISDCREIKHKQPTKQAKQKKKRNTFNNKLYFKCISYVFIDLKAHNRRMLVLCYANEGI